MPWKLRFLGVVIFAILDAAAILVFRWWSGDTSMWRLFTLLLIILFVTHSIWLLLGKGPPLGRILPP